MLKLQRFPNTPRVLAWRVRSQRMFVQRVASDITKCSLVAQACVSGVPFNGFLLLSMEVSNFEMEVGSWKWKRKLEVGNWKWKLEFGNWKWKFLSLRWKLEVEVEAGSFEVSKFEVEVGSGGWK